MGFCKVVFFYKIIDAAASFHLRGIFLNVFVTIFLRVYRRGLFLFEDDMLSRHRILWK